MTIFVSFSQTIDSRYEAADSLPEQRGRDRPVSKLVGYILTPDKACM
jgi:hypothetical protein